MDDDRKYKPNFGIPLSGSRAAFFQPPEVFTAEDIKRVREWFDSNESILTEMVEAIGPRYLEQPMSTPTPNGEVK